MSEPTEVEKLTKERDEFKALLDNQKKEAKTFKENQEKLEAELTQLRDANNKNKGDKDEVIKSLEKQVNDEKVKTRDLQKSFADKVIFRSIKSAAASKGCKNPDTLLKVLTKEQIKSVNSDDLEVDDKAVDELIEQAKKDHGYLFGEKTPPNKPPGTGNFDPKNKDHAAEYEKELKAAKNQTEFDAVRRKYGRLE